MSSPCACDDLAKALAAAEDRLALMGRAIVIALTPLPSMKGLGPKDREQRLRAELERRMREIKRPVEAANAI